MQYKTLKQQCEELLIAGQYDELQRLLSNERQKIAAEMEQTLAWVPVFLPRLITNVYAKLLSLVYRPALLQDEARLANQHRRLETIIEMERKLLDALNREAQMLMKEVGVLAVTMPKDKDEERSDSHDSVR